MKLNIYRNLEYVVQMFRFTFSHTTNQSCYTLNSSNLEAESIQALLFNYRAVCGWIRSGDPIDYRLGHISIFSALENMVK